MWIRDFIWCGCRSRLLKWCGSRSPKWCGSGSGFGSTKLEDHAVTITLQKALTGRRLDPIGEEGGPVVLFQIEVGFGQIQCILLWSATRGRLRLWRYPFRRGGGCAARGIIVRDGDGPDKRMKIILQLQKLDVPYMSVTLPSFLTVFRIQCGSGFRQAQNDQQQKIIFWRSGCLFGGLEA